MMQKEQSGSLGLSPQRPTMQPDADYAIMVCGAALLLAKVHSWSVKALWLGPASPKRLQSVSSRRLRRPSKTITSLPATVYLSLAPACAPSCRKGSCSDDV
jgi:hypothetical protein